LAEGTAYTIQYKFI